MTLIGIATYGDRAEFITDTVWYTRYVEQLGVTTKHMTLNHLDAAVLTGGNSEFGDYAQVSARKLGDVCATFDEMVERYQATLRGIRQDIDKIEGDSPATAFLVGYSHDAGEFVIYVYAEEQDWKPLRVSQWLMPTPWSFRPSGIEARRVAGDMLAADESRADRWPTVEPLWRGQQKWPAPTSEEDWLGLAQMAHEQRTVDNYCQTLVLGSIVHTRLERGAVTTRVLGNLTHTDEEYANILAQTRHPIGQMQACWCDSGQTFRDCHLRPYWTERCACGHPAGRTFYECCMVPDPVSVPVA